MKTALSLSVTCFVLILLVNTSAIAAKPLKVFILAGQSNMEGHAMIRTFDYIGDDPLTAPMLKEMRDADGNPRVCKDVWISYLTGNRRNSGEGFGQLTAGYGSRRDPTSSGEKIGPEFTFGIYLQKALDQPILLIKTAWGGKSLHTNFRPPSAGPYIPTEDDIKKERYATDEKKQALVEATGLNYRLMVDHVHRVLKDIKRVYPGYDEKSGYEIAGFVWFQGFNDMVGRNVYPDVPKDHPTPRFNNYTIWMADFIRDVRKDFDAPNMPFVIGVMGVGGLNSNQGAKDFRFSQSATADLPEFKGNVVAVPTAPYWDEALAALDEKNGKVRQMNYFLRTEHKDHANADGTMSDKEKQAYIERFRAELFSAEETALEIRGKSNAGYHYLGSAKTMGQIGKAFAEAMTKLQK